jgi:hypothetical protein
LPTSGRLTFAVILMARFPQDPRRAIIIPEPARGLFAPADP